MAIITYQQARKAVRMSIRTAQSKSKAIIRRFFEEVLGGRRLDLLSQYADSQMVAHLPYYPSKLQNIHQYRSFLEEFYRSFPAGRVEVDEIIAEGNKVVVRWRIIGKHVGNFMNLPSIDRPVKVYILSLFHLRNGKIVETWRLDSGFWLSPDY